MQTMVPLYGFGGVPYSAVRKAAPRNILDNSDFTNLVAQAGIGGNHGTIAYAADRWILDSGTVSYEAGVGLTLNGTIRQKLEFPPTGETSAFVGMASGAASISYADGEVTITSGGGVLKWAALYGGVYSAATMPDYQPKGYGAELAECQRYYEKINIPIVLVFGFGYYTAQSTDCRVKIHYKEKRIAPTATFNFTDSGVTCAGKYATINQIKNVYTETSSCMLNLSTTEAASREAAAMYASGSYEISCDL